MKLINKIIFILFIFFIVSYLIFIRLIMVHLPKELLCTSANFPYYLFSFFLLLCILIIKIYLYILPLSKDVYGNSWREKIKNKLQLDSYFTQLKKGHQYLIDKFDFLDNSLELLLKLILKHYLILRIMFFGLTYVPRYVVSIIFFFECIFYHKLSLFYSCLPILFIPLLCQYMLFALNYFVATSLESLNNFLQITVIINETEKYYVNPQRYNEYILSLTPGTDFKAFINFNASSQEYFKEQGRDVLEETKVIVAFFYSLVHFNHLSVDLNKLKLKYNFYLQTGTIIIYMVSWLYIILCTGEGFTEVIKLFNLFLLLADKEEPFSCLLID